jgi:hypothetical protein
VNRTDFTILGLSGAVLLCASMVLLYALVRFIEIEGALLMLG